jgi:hypothetical protein
MLHGQLIAKRTWPTTKPFALSLSKGMPEWAQGFDKPERE